MMTKVKMQLDEFKEKNRLMQEENIRNTEKVKIYEQQLVSYKIAQNNLKIQVKSKENEYDRNKDQLILCETLKQEKLKNDSKLEEMSKQVKFLKGELEYLFL